MNPQDVRSLGARPSSRGEKLTQSTPWAMDVESERDGSVKGNTGLLVLLAQASIRAVDQENFVSTIHERERVLERAPFRPTQRIE